MRKFTKDHNELDWLFPYKVNELTAVEEFEMYENLANTYFDLAHKTTDSFDKDDLIDAFMKGASVANQFISSRLPGLEERELNRKQFLEETAKFSELLDKFKDKLGIK